MRRSRLGLFALILIVIGGGIAIWSMGGGGGSSNSTPTAASFGFQDWLVRCQQAQGQVGCGMSQQVLDQRTRQAVVQLHLGRAPSGTGHQLVVVLPLGVSLANGATLEAGDFKRQIAFTQCLPAGCVGPTAADQELLDKMGAAEGGRVTVISRSGQPVAIPFSLKGFEPAFEKMEAHGGIGNSGATWWTGLWNSSETK